MNNKIVLTPVKVSDLVKNQIYTDISIISGLTTFLVFSHMDTDGCPCFVCLSGNTMYQQIDGFILFDKSEEEFYQPTLNA